jgi:hypothetical protein
VAGRFLLIILALGNYHQYAWGNGLSRPIREIYKAFPLKTIEGLICGMPVHWPFIARNTMVNPDMIVVRIEKQAPAPLNAGCSLTSIRFAGINTSIVIFCKGIAVFHCANESSHLRSSAAITFGILK